MLIKIPTRHLKRDPIPTKIHARNRKVGVIKRGTGIVPSADPIPEPEKPQAIPMLCVQRVISSKQDALKVLGSKDAPVPDVFMSKQLAVELLGGTDAT